MRSNPNIALGVQQRDFASPLIALQERNRQKKIDDSNLKSAELNQQAAQNQIDQQEQAQRTGVLKSVALDTMAVAELLRGGHAQEAGALMIQNINKVQEISPEADTTQAERWAMLTAKDPKAGLEFYDQHIEPVMKATMPELFKEDVLSDSQVNDQGQVITRGPDGIKAVDVEGFKSPVEDRPIKEDENGFLRYTDGTKERVFPEVEKLEEELTGKDRFDMSKSIRGEITNANKDFTDIANSWDRISASIDDPSAAGDLALVFNFMKMLDPGSTVREGEFANAENSAGVPTRIVGMYNKLVSGERLPPEQRSDFFGQAQNIFDASKARADQLTNEYVRIAEKSGLSRDDVVVDRGASPDSRVGETTITQEDINNSPRLQELNAKPGQKIVDGKLTD